MRCSSPGHSTTRTVGARFPRRPSGIAALAAALVLGGCTAGPVPPRADDALATRADPLERILRQAEREADPQRQADAYFRALMLARSTREDMVPALVERLRSPRQPNTASLAQALSATRQHELLGVALELALARSDDAEMVQLLRLLAGGDAEQSALTGRARAKALGRLGEHWAAAQALMEVLAQPGVAEAAAIATTVWRHLSRVSVAELNRQARAAAAPRDRGMGRAGAGTSTPGSRQARRRGRGGSGGRGIQTIRRLDTPRPSWPSPGPNDAPSLCFYR